MDLKACLGQFASGAALQNTVADHLARITSHNAAIAGLSSLAGLSDVAATVAGITASVEAKWTSMLARLPIALPAMKAVHLLEKAMEMQDGGMASSAGSASFQAYFGAVDDIQGQMAAVQSSVSTAITRMGTLARDIAGVVGTGPDALASLARQIPPPRIPDTNQPGQQITNPAYTAFIAKHSATLAGLTATANGVATAVRDVKTSLEGLFAAAERAYENGFEILKGMAFAQFCAMAQPEPVRDAIRKTVKALAIPRIEDIVQVNRASTAWRGAQMVAITRDAPAVATQNPEHAGWRPTVDAAAFTPTRATPAQLAAIRAQRDAQHAVVQAASDAADVPGRAFLAWMASVGYAEVKNNKARDPAAYEALRARAQTHPSYLQTQARMAVYETEKARLIRLRDILDHMFNVGPWPGNPDGPW